MRNVLIATSAVMLIASGAHTIVLKCPDGKEERQSVTIPVGERRTVEFRGG